MIERGLGRLFSYDLSSTGDDPDRTAPVGGENASPAC